MIHTIKLGGENRSVLCGNWAFKKLKEEKGITLGDISQAMQNQDVTVIPEILYYSLKAAAIYEKKEADFDADTVALWMDMESGITATVLPWIVDAITDMTGEAATDDTKKKAKK